tara:strand:- start:3719 stop:4246 length:528 start_codon:yes stop_codon:yes gene_type:complete
MTIEFEIIPRKKKHFTWNELRDNLRELRPQLFPPTAAKMPSFWELDRGIEREVTAEESIGSEGQYRFETDKQYTLFLGTYSNVATYTNEEEWLADYAMNLAPDLRKTLAEQWRSVGFSYDVGIKGIRYDPGLVDFFAVLLSAAQLCDGYIVLKERKPSGIPHGAYLPEEIRNLIE